MYVWCERAYVFSIFLLPVPLWLLWRRALPRKHRRVITKARSLKILATTHSDPVSLLSHPSCCTLSKIFPIVSVLHAMQVNDKAWEKADAMFVRSTLPKKEQTNVWLDYVSHACPYDMCISHRQRWASLLCCTVDLGKTSSS